MKFAILAICVAVAAAKPHVYLYDGAAPIGSDGRVIDTPEVMLAKAEHIAALAAASAKQSSSGTVQTGYSYPIPATTYGLPTPVVSYQGPPAPLAEDGRVIDTAEVAQLKAEHLAVLKSANAAAAAAEESAAAHAKVHTVYGAPITMEQIQQVPTFIMADPIAVPIKPGYSGPPAPLGEDGRVIDTEEVAKLKAEHLAALEQANAAAAAFAAASGSSMSTYSSEGYTYNTPIVTEAETIPIEAPVKPQQVYNGPPAPLGEDGRVIDTEEVAKLKAEHLAALEKANAAAAAFAAASKCSTSTFSSEGYTYVAPVVQHTETFAVETPAVVSQYVYNGPPAPIGQDGHVVDTEEVAKLKEERIATLDQAHAEAIAAAAASGYSMSSSEGYTYNAPAIQYAETISQSPVIKSQQVYNGPPAPLGEDGRVIDTEEVAKLKAEHLAALEQANAAAIALAAASGASMSTFSSGGYTYNAPIVHDTQTIVGTPAIKPQQVYNGPPAPLGEDGRVVDTEEVAKLKSERIATLEQANAAAAAFATESGYSTSSSEGYTYNAPAIQFTETIVETPVIKPQQVYNGPPAPLGEDGRVVDTEEVAKLKAEHLAALEKANAAAAAFAAASGSSMSTFSSGGYTYNAPVVQYTETIAETPATKPQQVYNGPPAPLGEDGRVVDTEEVAKLKSERIATLDQANAAAAAFAAASGYSKSSSEGYTYNAPAVQYTEIIVETPVIKPQQVYNGPPAPLGEDGRVIDTEEVAKLKAEHLAALEKANAAAAAFAAASGSSMSEFSAGGYTYNTPIVSEVQTIPTETPAVKPQQVYNGPPAPLGEDGRVIDTEEVAKLKAEHLAALEKANAAAAAFAAASGASMSTFTSEGYFYNAPIVHNTQTIVETPITKPHQIYNGPPAPIGEDGRVIDTEEVAKLKAEHISTLEQANAAAAATASASETSSSSKGYSYEAPVVPQTSYGPPATTYGAPAIQHTETIVESSPVITKPQHIYNGPPAPIGEDGRVIDTEEVSKLKAEHLATLNEAIAASAAFEATSTTASPSESHSAEKQILPAATYGPPATTYGAPAVVQTFAIENTPTVAKPQQTYGGPLAPLSEDGQVIDTDEVAQLKAEHLATIAQANAKVEASAATETSSSSAEITYGAPIVQQVQTFIAVARDAKPSTYYGPPAPLSADGNVVDTDEVARLKEERLAILAEATAKAIAQASTEIDENQDAAGYSPPLPSTRPLPSFTGPVTEIKPIATPAVPHAIVQRVIRRRPVYTGPLAPLGANGRVIDTEEVAKLKEERLATLKHATMYAIKLAQAKKTAGAEIVNSPSDAT